MYIIYKSQQLNDPKEAFNPYSSSTFIADIATNLSTLPRLTDQTRSSIVFITEKPEKALAAITPSYRHGLDGALPALFRLGKPDIATHLLNMFTTSMSTGEFPNSVQSLHHYASPQK